MLIFIAYFGYRGYQRGLVDEVGRLVGLVLAAILANKYAPVLANHIGLENELARNALAFLAIFILTLIVMGLATRALRVLVELVLLDWLDRLGGTLFGLVKSLVVLGVLIYVMESFELPRNFLSRLDKESLVYRNVLVLKDSLFRVLTLDRMIEDVHERMKELEPEDLLRPLLED